ncbi:hypothetical protein Tco_0202423 [Tanacetum coccineum]
MSTILALSYPSSNNQLETSSNPMHQVAMPERQTLSYMGNCSTGNDHIAGPYTQSKKIQCLKQQMLLTQLQEAGIQLSKDQLAILADGVEVHNPDNMDYNMINQGVQVMSSSEQLSVMNHSETEITSDSNIIPYSQYVTESQ